MKKVAIIFDGNIEHPKGKVNSIINRSRELKAIADFQIDVYTVQEYDSLPMRLLLKGHKKVKASHIILGGVEMKIIWHKRFFIDWLLSQKLHKKPILSLGEAKLLANHLRGYDLIISHSFYCGYIALTAHNSYGIPYVTNWHGSEIHTQPFRNQYQLTLTKKILKDAEMNFFVSKSLAEIASSYAGEIKKDVLYNGVNEAFFAYDDERKHQLKKDFGVEDCKVVAYVGNLIDIKNPLVLPRIFIAVKTGTKEQVRFWIIGDGKLRSQLEQEVEDLGISSITTFWGDQPFERIPDFMNCIDVVVLPSKNESFGMVLVEAMACGANAVGSNMGGIPEILGNKNVFSLDNGFSDNISLRICEMLNNKSVQSLHPDMRWGRTAQKENNIIKSII